MKLIAINTIGLTGAEILCAELARHPEVRMIPGQNFIRFRNVCYRLHDYRGMSSADIFEMMSMHHYTRSGKCWSGLTKSMSEKLRANYDREAHKATFAAGLKGDDFLDLARLFGTSYYTSQGDDLKGCEYVGWFGHNIIANAQRYPRFDETAVVINFSNPIDYWLANINQRFVWNNLNTLKFWIVNELAVRAFAKQRQNYLNVDVREYAHDQQGVTRKIRKFLGFALEGPINPEAPDGFIRFSKSMVDKIEADAVALKPIYQDHAFYKLAESIEEWSEAFLESKEVRHQLNRYSDFWNSTSHTNLDWVGPVEEEIVEMAIEKTGLRSERNLSRWFFHDCFDLSCDHFDEPKSKLEHYLGSLEEEIAFPALAYYARVVVCYIESVAGNMLRRPYSSVPIRETNLYRRLTSPEMSRFFPLWAMSEKVATMEEAIDRANAAISPYYPVSR